MLLIIICLISYANTAVLQHYWMVNINLVSASGP